MNQPTEKFDLWCLVELFGHAKIAGRCTEQNIAGTNMLRVDVPETAAQPAFTRLFGSAAIYAVNPIDEETCKHMAAKLEVKPIDTWNISEVIKKYNQHQLEAATKEKELDHYEYDNDNELDPDYGPRQGMD